jgi:hypothetical protein
MEFTSHRQSWSQAVQTTTSWPAIPNGGRSVLRVGYRTLADEAHPFNPFRRKHNAKT